MNWSEYCHQYVSNVIALYEQVHHRQLNLRNPQTFTEKLQWLKIYDSTQLKSLCADKVNIHKYFKAIIGTDIGVPILKIFDNTDTITPQDIQCNTVLKCNHGSGMNIILTEANRPSLAYIKETMKKWIHEDYGAKFFELYYSRIKPIMFKEAYLDDISDVKVFCFNGLPKFYQSDHHLTEHRQNFYDLTWQPITWLSRKDYPANYNIQDPKPPLDIIYSYASKLCKPFKFVRCDFIISNGRVYGGEMTFIPGAGNQEYDGDADKLLGSYLML